MTTAWLVRTTTESWMAGIAMGSAMVSQPMLLHAISDGTPEHLALWSMPLFLGLAIVALQTMNTRWALAAGIMALVVALDSPYNAIYTALVVEVGPTQRRPPFRCTSCDWACSQIRV